MESDRRSGLSDFQGTLDRLHSRDDGLNDPSYWRRTPPAPPPPPHTLSLHGATLTCNANVAVVTGPVIGRVTADAAVVLLEVSIPARVTCVVSAVTLKHPQGVVVATASLDMPERVPRAFVVKGLRPGKRHVVMFSGVNRSDAATRVGALTTLPATCGRSNTQLRIATISGAAPGSATEDAWDGWDALRHDVMCRRVALVVHCGGQVSE